MMTELIVALSLLGLIFAGLALSMQGFGAFNRHQWARQQCIAAAQAQLDSLTTRGLLIETQTCQRLWPTVNMTVQRAPGIGQWDGLELARVTATSQAGPRQVRVDLARYLQPSSRQVERGSSL
jgi:type II secretory pathway pseudopilin PulG